MICQDASLNQEEQECRIQFNVYNLSIYVENNVVGKITLNAHEINQSHYDHLLNKFLNARTVFVTSISYISDPLSHHRDT